MLLWLKQPFRRAFLSGVGFGLLLGGLLGVGMLVGALSTRHFQADAAIPAELLRGATADAGDFMAIATGPIDQGIEGVFFLDFVTGRISGGVMNPKTLAPLGAFGYDTVYRDLGIPADVKNPKLLMATGMTNVKNYSGNVSLADSIVYVVDTSTGNYACYGLPWNKQALNWNAFTPSPMVLLGRGSARQATIRAQQ